MATNLPVYRLTVFAPKVEDATELTVLTPIAGAAHSDPFVVTSIQGVAGAQPYLGIPKGRSGSFDPVTKRTTTGALSLEVFDPRTTPGGANAARWSTAFIGDTRGRPRLKGCKFTLERSLDGTAASLVPFFAGRIHDVSTTRPLWLDLGLRDYADDLNRKVFLGAPHTSVASYAASASLLPAGVPQAFGDLVPPPPLTGVMSTNTADVLFLFNYGMLTLDAFQAPGLALITKAVHESSAGTVPRIVRLSNPTTGALIGSYRWPQSLFREEEEQIPGDVAHYRQRTVFLQELPLDDPRYAALPIVGTWVAFAAYQDAPPSKALPILINDVHPVQHFADVIDGKYSRTPGYETLRPLAIRDAAVWNPLIADPSFGLDRYLIESTMKANEHIERDICQRHNLAFRFDASGRIVPIDLRRTTTLAAALTLTDDDLVTGVEPSWNDSRDGAITGVNATYYVDRPAPGYDILKAPAEYPDLSPTLILTAQSSVFVTNDLSTLRDVGEKIVEIDARGARATDTEVTATGQLRVDVLKADLQTAIADFLRPFASGTVKARAVYRLLGGAAAVSVGTYGIVQHTKLPDPATNERGGARLMLCLARDDADGRITIEWLDCGANTIAAAPAITAVQATPDGAGVDVAITLNAAVDPVELWTCVTATTVAVRPAETADAWIRAAGTLAASGWVRAAPLPRGTRIWVRARSQRGGSALALPSIWVYPAGAGYLDLGGPTAGSALVASNVFANRVDLRWVLGDLSLEVEVYQTLGAVPAAWTPAMQIQTLQPGTTRTRVGSLTALTQYAFGVRVRDASGGASGMATVTAVTTSTLGVAPEPVLLDIAVGGFAA